MPKRVPKPEAIDQATADRASETMELVFKRRVNEIIDLVSDVISETQHAHRWATEAVPPGIYDGDLAEAFDTAFAHAAIAAVNFTSALKPANAPILGHPEELARMIDTVSVGCTKLAAACYALSAELQKREGRATRFGLSDPGPGLMLESARRLLVLESGWLRRWAQRRELETLADDSDKKAHARRMKRYRAMQAKGFKIASVKYHVSDIDRLRKFGLLGPGEATQDEIEAAVDNLMQIAFASMEGMDKLAYAKFPLLDEVGSMPSSSLPTLPRPRPPNPHLGRMRGLARFDYVAERIHTIGGGDDDPV